MRERRFKLVLEYEGTGFSGFQKQRGERTVQEELETALEKILKQKVKVVGAGRTDAGVHAVGQVVAFSTTASIPTRAIVPALNSTLPRDIVVKSARQVEANFHPRFDAKSRVYRYTIDNKKVPSAMLRRYAWHIPERLNVARMQKAASFLVGAHDFCSFHASGSNLGGTVRELKRLSCWRRGGLVLIDIEANAFLYHMARIIVGTLVEIGLGKREPQEMKEILEARDRKRAGPTAPAHGLCLMKVRY